MWRNSHRPRHWFTLCSVTFFSLVHLTPGSLIHYEGVKTTTIADPCLTEPKSCDDDDDDETIRILSIFGICIGGTVAFLFMGFFFFCLWYRSKTKWSGLEKDTPFPQNPTVITLKEEGPKGTIVSQTRRLSIPESSRTLNPAATAALNIKRMSGHRDVLYSFEDV